MNRVFWVEPFSRFENNPEPTLYFLTRKTEGTLFLEQKHASLLERFDFDPYTNRILTVYSSWENECFREVIDSIKTAFEDNYLDLSIGSYKLLNHAQLLIAIWNSDKEFNTTKVLDELVRIFSIISIPPEDIIKVEYSSRLVPKLENETGN